MLALAVLREVLAKIGSLMRRVRMEDDPAMYLAGSANGDGAELDVGHSKMYPAGDWGSGVTRKLSLATAL